MLSVMGSMLSGGNSICDVDRLRSSATGAVFDGVRAPATVGSWLRTLKNAVRLQVASHLLASGRRAARESIYEIRR